MGGELVLPAGKLCARLEEGGSSTPMEVGQGLFLAAFPDEVQIGPYVFLGASDLAVQVCPDLEDLVEMRIPLAEILEQRLVAPGNQLQLDRNGIRSWKKSIS